MVTVDSGEPPTAGTVVVKGTQKPGGASWRELKYSLLAVLYIVSQCSLRPSLLTYCSLTERLLASSWETDTTSSLFHGAFNWYRSPLPATRWRRAAYSCST